jgi:hypothetical protein
LEHPLRPEGKSLFQYIVAERHLWLLGVWYAIAVTLLVVLWRVVRWSIRCADEIEVRLKDLKSLGS